MRTHRLTTLYVISCCAIMVTYIVRRERGMENRIEAGEVSAEWLFWVSGVWDGIVAVVIFTVLCAVFHRLFIRKFKREMDRKGKEVVDTF